MSVSCAFMAARLKQAAREQKRIVRGAAMGVLRDVVGMAEQRMSIAGQLARNVWGATNRRGTWRAAFWRGRKATQRSLGLLSRTRPSERTGAKWARLGRDRQRANAAASRISARTGRKAFPLIVRIRKTRWNSETLQTGVYASGIAGNIERGTPFKPHRQGQGMHPGGPVHQHPVLDRAMSTQQSKLSRNVRAAIEGFLAGVVNG